MKYTLTLQQDMPFAQSPRFAELEGNMIFLNDVMLPKHIDASVSYNPHDVRLWVIGHEFGAICAVWASHEQDALDAACDLNAMDYMLAENQDHDDESLAACGNASELFDLTYAWLAPVEFEAARDIQLIVAIVRAAENQADTLE